MPNELSDDIVRRWRESSGVGSRSWWLAGEVVHLRTALSKAQAELVEARDLLGDVDNIAPDLARLLLATRAELAAKVEECGRMREALEAIANNPFTGDLNRVRARSALSSDGGE